MRTLDYTREKIAYLPIKLDEIGLINVKTPTKAEFEELIGFLPRLRVLQEAVDSNEVEDANVLSEVIDELYNVVALLMSRNREEKNVDPVKLQELLPLDFAIDFLNEYSNFVTERKAAREKN